MYMRVCVCVCIDRVRKVNQYAGMHECVGGYTPVHLCVGLFLETTICSRVCLGD